MFKRVMKKQNPIEGEKRKNMKYRKKPVEIEAFHWLGYNDQELHDFMKNGREYEIEGTSVMIKTLEGVMEARKNDWIIRGVEGELYPCKPDIFDKTYEEI